MERLTKPGTVYNFAKLDPAEQNWLERVQAKLAVYEDTGLTPEEINSLRMDMAIIKALFEYMEVDRMKELTQADKEGRLVVLPCKVGDTVYIPHYAKGVVAARVQGISVSVSGRAILRFGGYPFESAWGDGCGKDWFLTREEAEVVLRGGDGG